MMDSDNLSSHRELEALKHEHAVALQLKQENALSRLEALKYELSIKREVATQEARAREIEFIEAGQSIRSLNVFMWQVPGMAIAVTGGLWFGASTIVDNNAKTMVFLFACLIDVLLIAIIWRIRFLVEIDIKRQLVFRKSSEESQNLRYIVVIVWTLLLTAAASIGLAGALNPSRVAQRPSIQTPTGEVQSGTTAASDSTRRRESNSPPVVSPKIPATTIGPKTK